MEIKKWSYSDLATNGLEGAVRSLLGKDYLAIACHKGLRRSPVSARGLENVGIRIANSDALPTICYSDFKTRRIQIARFGLMIPEKTDRAFQALLLFHDDSIEEKSEVRWILEDFRSGQMRGTLHTLMLANVRDHDEIENLI